MPAADRWLPPWRTPTALCAQITWVTVRGKLLRKVFCVSYRPTYRGAVGVKGKLYTTGDIADRLGITRQYALTITKDRTKHFPESFDDLQSGSVWLVEDVEQWIRENRSELAQDPEGS